MIVGLSGCSERASAQEAVTDWYIKSFDSQIILNPDSTASITEKIVADCGDAPDKHGIFRILPTFVNIEGKKIDVPVTLAAITDENGNPLTYSTIRSADGTVTWKIGNPKVFVHGVNYYHIYYTVANVIRFNDQKFDEFYWNLSGNYWDLQIRDFHATILFPQGVTQHNAVVDYYTGNIGNKSKDLAKYAWNSPRSLVFSSTGTLEKMQGITASVTFPKGIFTPYVPSFLDQYRYYLFALIPLATLCVFCFLVEIWQGPESRQNDHSRIWDSGKPVSN